MKSAEILDALAAILSVSSSGRLFPLCGLESTCDPYGVPGCQDVPVVAVLIAVVNGNSMQPILGSDDEVLSIPSWIREPTQAEQWVTEPPTNTSVVVCNGCFVTTSRAARASPNENIALGELLPVNTTFLTSIARRLFTGAEVAADKLVKIETDADVIAKILQIESIFTSKEAQRDELQGGLACLAPGGMHTHMTYRLQH